MDKQDINLLIEQIKNILLNKPLSEKLRIKCEELSDLQEALFYLSNCLSESNEFLKHLQMGNLDAKPPSRHNFLAGNLKELHSSLKHLTWQANQVANGDYSQSVNFFGDFSTSFNQMIHQLAERETKLKNQTVALKETVNLIKSIINGLKDWIIVTDNETGEIIYTNHSAKQLFYNIETEEFICKQPCKLMEHLTQYNKKNKDHLTFDYTCPLSLKTLRAKSFTVQWNNKLAYAHYIQDVTNEKEYQEQMEEMAYTDALTGLYNRRYCIGQLDMLISKKNEFAFCLIDLDELKYANDNFGHAAGDKYIKTVANEMLEITDDTNTVCRIGGDEFAILFHNYNLEIILDKMNRVTKKVENLSNEFPMSISYGIIHVEQEAKILSETVMAQADEKMYILKNIKKATKRNLGQFQLALTWTKELETGNAQIDAEHKELINAINNLLTACAEKKETRELSNTINFLNQYAKTHFSHEQTLQIQSGYPDYKNHRKYHKWFIKIIEDISFKLKTTGSSIEIVNEINKQLGSWLVNHIKTEDVKVANYILSKKK